VRREEVKTMEYVNSFMHEFLPNIKEVVLWFAIIGTICIGLVTRIKS